MKLKQGMRVAASKAQFMDGTEQGWDPDGNRWQHGVWLANATPEDVIAVVTNTKESDSSQWMWMTTARGDRFLCILPVGQLFMNIPVIPDWGKLGPAINAADAPAVNGCDCDECLGEGEYAEEAEPEEDDF